ncbi:non-ribosomal peptide synthetase [Streptomyces sp. KMM 9044]|uniref:non-ribosomal peptide synthetase n=1 Tax=Streptomyces sp. KMM 9044 TaxID=2744474 RepID=UPI002151C66F|nr:non-ribosomal peptide synthetase [Streptomyces sp. KMM 9044]WAX76551.1 non-ribosomal peptide synthetase [Streptomyces sp. KMM 9044]
MTFRQPVPAPERVDLLGLCLGAAPAQDAPAADAPALRDTLGHTLSHRQLAAAVTRRAQELRTAGAGPGRLVRVDAERTTAAIVDVLAVLAAGAAFAALPPGAQPSPGVTEALAGRRDLPAGAAYVMTTSGSTGVPKETVVTREGLRHVFGALRDAPQLGFPKDLVWAQFHPLSFGYSMCEILGALAFGGEIALVEREAPLTCDGLRALMGPVRAEGRRTVLCLTPSELSLLTARLLEANMAAPEFVLLSGEPAHRGQLTEFLALPGGDDSVVVNTYAATETAGQITADRVTTASVSSIIAGYVGHPLPGTTVTLLTADGTPVPPRDHGTTGEVHVQGPGVAAGYLDPGQTAARFVPAGPLGETAFRTGDLGRWAEDGGLRIVGRGGRRLKVAGRWVSLDAVEHALLTGGCVREAFAAAAEIRLDGPAPQECLQVVAVPRDRSGVTAKRIRGQVAAALGTPLTVRLVLVDALPRTPHGKADTRAPAIPPASVAAVGGPANLVRAVWEEILGAGIPYTTNLFEAGVDSLGVVTAAARLTRVLGRPVTAAFLLDHPRLDLQIAALATSTSPPGAAPAARGAAARRPGLAEQRTRRRAARGVTPTSEEPSTHPTLGSQEEESTS